MDAYRWKLKPADLETVQAIQEATHLSRPAALVLASRGITADKAPEFLKPSLRNLVDPYLIPGNLVAAERLWQAIRRNETVLIHGDYDTDGVTASVLLAKVLTHNGAKVETFLPHRMDDGYGLTPESIEKACRDHHSLLVTVDCGITSHLAVEAAKAQGVEVIVTDHHEPGEIRPSALALIDPKLNGTDARVRELAGVGVAFKVCHGFIKYGRERGLGGFSTDLREVLDLVALGTVADIVPLLDENRCLVKYGLQVLSRQHRPGIRALCELVGLDAGVRSTDIAYRIAPRLNAPGRMGDPMLSMRLLQAESMAEAFPLAKALDDENRKRQELEAETFTRARDQIATRCNIEDDRTIVVWGEQWHQGVLGIVAARLSRTYHRPCIVMTRDASGMLSGSGRSVQGVNLVGVLEQCQQYLTRFGGHPMAAGLSLKDNDVIHFCHLFEATVRKGLTLDEMLPQIEICGEIGFDEITDIFLGDLDVLRPFGQGHPEPVFFTRRVTPYRIQPAGRDHTRGVLRDGSGAMIDFVAFNRRPEEFCPPPWDAAYLARLNTFGGRSRPQAHIVDVRPAE
ncbi:MAG: Single-stranded-DNA-specific exonuclease RecJ [Lentisphaerae bacterium ADurb.BinA184]|nr:MAG: Single-stranded-DNA-specific exonuclease RecJ [Lentisphaerae bacterium ADurb.BinA184]